METAFELDASVIALMDQIRIPLILVSGERVALANQPAQSLLGAHIVGQDVRLAIRHPAAVSLVSDPQGGAVTIGGLSTPTSLWEVSVQQVGLGWRLIELHDRSAQSDVSRAHTDFVANASHELRTPLAAILGYVETLLEPQAGADTGTRERFLQIVQREARRLQQLVEDLMSLSRIEAVKHDRPDDLVDLGAIARQVVADLNGAHDAKIVVRAITQEQPALMAGDMGQLSQLIRNLVDNGIRHGGGDQPVTVETAIEGGSVRLVVTDHGTGIEAAHLPRLTERFYRVDASRSRDAGGTGLGLAIVKHIVERHRGRLDIDSTPGTGTSVRVNFPSADQDGVIKES